VVAGRDVVVSTRADNLHDDTTNQRRRSIVEERREVVGVRDEFSRVAVVTRSSQDEGAFEVDRGGGVGGEFTGTNDSTSVVVAVGDVEEGNHTINVQGGRVRVVSVEDGDQVGTISTTSTLTGITSLTITTITTVVVSVGTSPLDVDPVVGGDRELAGDEVVFDRRESLDNVTTLTTDVQVPDGTSGEAGRTLLDVEQVSTILESTAKLISVDGESERLLVRANVDSRVLTDRRVVTVHGGVDVPSVVIISGDVVTETEDTLGIFSVVDLGGTSGGISEGIKIREGPEVVGHISGTTSVTEVIVTGPRGLATVNSRETPGELLPSATSISASRGRSSGQDSTSGGSRSTLVLEVVVLRVGPDVGAAGDIRGEVGDISPRGGLPVRIVVTFFRAFETTAGTTGVLAGVDGGVAVEVLVSSEETLVAAARVAFSVPGSRFVHTLIGGGTVSVDLVGVGTIAHGGLEGRFVEGIRIAHVLNDHFTVVDGRVRFFVTTTAVLGSPFDEETRAFEEHHGVLSIGGLVSSVVDGSGVVPEGLSVTTGVGRADTNVDTTTIVVLGVEQAVTIVTLSVSFVQTVVVTARVLHVHISQDAGSHEGDQDEGEIAIVRDCGCWSESHGHGDAARASHGAAQGDCRIGCPERVGDDGHKSARVACSNYSASIVCRGGSYGR